MDHQSGRNEGMGAYGKLFLALGLSLVVMFPLTMAFVAQWSHFHLNLSNFYMAVAMVAPMGLIMLGVMRGMFPDRRLNAGLVIGFLALFALGLWLGRTEAFVGDAQFLRAMIPHHSRAILVCQEAALTDPEIEQLCGQIISSQQEEIDIMNQMLGER
ncbi:MAG: hypothetical protein K0S78_2373 [Thermomicrobiales bacterium]|jgi:hypothetical protein|nr:hypothetical protein [Thermomicrobiales bacterium]